MSRVFYVVAAIVALVLVGYVVYQWAGNRGILAPASVSLSTVPSDAPPTPPPAASTPLAADTPPAAENVIVYTDSGFSPSVLTVSKGTTVTFENQSSAPFWPASNPHPAHNGYPTTGGCRASTFDACGPIPSGGSWSFTFDIVGTWGYHDHLAADNGGTAVVQ